MIGTQRTLASRSLHAVFWSYLGAGARVLAQLVIQVGLARMLGPSSFGQASTVLVVMGIGWLLADGGFGSALIQKSELTDDDIAFTLAWIVIFSVLIGTGVFIGSPALAAELGDPALIPLVKTCAVLIPLQALSNVPASLLRRELDMKRQQILSVGTYIAGMGVVGLALAVAGFGAWALIIGYGVQLGLSLVIGYWLAPFPLRLQIAHVDRKFRDFGLSVLATNLANWAIENLDRLLVGRFWGVASMGEYSAAANLARAPSSILVGTLQTVVFSTTARAQEESTGVRRAFLAALCLVTLVATPLFCLLAVEAEAVMHLLYGSRWGHAAPLFAALCLSIPSYAVLSIAGPMLWGLGAARVEFQVQVCVAMATVFGYLLLSSQPLAQAVWLVPVLALLRSGWVVAALAPRLEIGWQPVLRALSGGLLLGLVAACIAWLVRLQLGNGLPAAFAGAVLALVAALALLHWRGARLLAPDLSTALTGRAGSSSLARRVCLIAGLSVREG